MEQPPVRIHSIIIEGNDRTQNIILRVLGMYEGQILSWPQIRGAEERLANPDSSTSIANGTRRSSP